jgi:quercetin dioxygenase-like cupin family protein
MRVFEMQPKSSTPYHHHPWEHEIFVLAGSGVVRVAQAERQLSEGDAVLVAPNEQHSFINTGEALFRFICIIPLVDGKVPSMPPA